MGGVSGDDAGKMLRRLKPEVWRELNEYCVPLQFKGAREKVQPTLSLQGVFIFIMRMPGAGAARFRAKVAMMLVRLMANETDDINACRDDPKLRGLFADIAREEVAAAAGAGAPVDDAETLQLQRRTQLRLEHADAVMKDAVALTAAADAVRVKAAADVDALQLMAAADSRIRKQRDEDASEEHVKRMREADEMRLQKLREADDLNAKALLQANTLIEAKAREEAIARQAAQALANDSLRATARGLLLKRAETIAAYYAVLPDTPDRQQRVDAYVALLEQQAYWEAPPPQAAPPPPPPREQIPGGAFLLRDFVKIHRLLDGVRGDARALVLRDAGRNLTDACTGRGLPVFRMGGESNRYPMEATRLAFDIIAALVRAAHGQPDIGGFFTQPSQPAPPQPDDAERAPAGAGAAA